MLAAHSSPKKRFLINVYAFSFLSNDKLCALYTYFNICIEHVYGEIPVVYSEGTGFEWGRQWPYKSEGRGFGSRWCHGNFSFTLTMVLALTQPLTEISTRNIFWELRRPVPRADKITNFLCRLSWNLGASDSWNSQGLSRPLMGLLYISPGSSISWNLRVPLEGNVRTVAESVPSQLSI